MRNPTEIGGCPMTQISELAKDTLKDLITIERTLWENNAEIYHDGYSPEALLIFPGVGRIDRDTAVAAIRRENAEGHIWAVDYDRRCCADYLHGDGSLELRVERVQNALCLRICPSRRILASGLPPTDAGLEPHLLLHHPRHWQPRPGINLRL